MQKKAAESPIRGGTSSRKAVKSAVRGSISRKKAAESTVRGVINSKEAAESALRGNIRSSESEKCSQVQVLGGSGKLFDARNRLLEGVKGTTSRSRGLGATWEEFWR